MCDIGDDCYFYYYSKCIKADTCPFRHVEAALGNETTCSLWRSGHCYRPKCMYRHMEIAVDRRNIPCYWENQPTGCTKPNCIFKHFKPKDDSASDPPRNIVDANIAPTIQAVGLPADTPVNTDPTAVVLKAPPKSDALLSRNTSSPQLELENRPSPKIDPIVVNPFSDDSDHETEPVVTVKPVLLSTAELNLKQQKDAGLKKTALCVKDKNSSDAEILDSEKEKNIVMVKPGLTRRNVIIDIGEPSKADTKVLKVNKVTEQNVHKLSLSERMKRRLGKRSNRDSRDEPLEKKQSLSIKSRLGIHEKKVKSRLGIRREALSSEEESTVIVHTPYVDLDPTPAKGEGVLNRWEAAIKNRPKKVKEIKKSPPVSSDSSGSSSDEIDSIVVKTLEEIKQEKARKAQAAASSVETKPRASHTKPVCAGFLRRRAISHAKPKQENDECPSKLLKLEDSRLDLPVAKKLENGQSEISSVDDQAGTCVPAKPRVTTQASRAPKKERQIYKPPALKSSGEMSPGKVSAGRKVAITTSDTTPVVQAAEKTELPTKAVEIKTFAQIMEEKRMKRLEQLAARNGETAKQKVNIRPIIFDLDEKDSADSASPKDQVSAVATRISQKTVKSKKLASVKPLQQVSKNMPSSHLVSPLNRTASEFDANVSDSQTVKKPSSAIVTSSAILADVSNSTQTRENTSSVSSVRQHALDTEAESTSTKKQRHLEPEVDDDDDLLDLNDFSVEENLDCDKIDDAALMNDLEELLS